MTTEEQKKKLLGLIEELKDFLNCAVIDDLRDDFKSDYDFITQHVEIFLNFNEEIENDL